jgi:hypothetical protein
MQFKIELRHERTKELINDYEAETIREARNVISTLSAVTPQAFVAIELLQYQGTEWVIIATTKKETYQEQEQEQEEEEDDLIEE